MPLPPLTQEWEGRLSLAGRGGRTERTGPLPAQVYTGFGLVVTGFNISHPGFLRGTGPRPGALGHPPKLPHLAHFLASGMDRWAKEEACPTVLEDRRDPTGATLTLEQIWTESRVAPK